MNKLKKLLVPLYRRIRFIQYFIKDKSKISLIDRLWCLQKGFFPKNYILYDLTNNDYSKYITDFEEYAKMSHINKSTHYVNDKLVFTEIIKSFVEMPEVLGIIENGSWLKYGKNGLDSIKELLSRISNKNEGVILKPISGDGGIGIVKLEFNGKCFIWNQEMLELDVTLKRIKKLDGYYVSDLVKQHNYSDLIYPFSINSIRLLTMIDKDSNKAFIAAASHRIGNNRSFPVDNCAKGGLTAKIDLNTGILGKAVRTYFQSDKPNYYTKHPDTGTPIEGAKVPNWEEIKKKTLEMAKSFQFLPYLAWDIVLLPNGEITVLEANDGADLKLHQVHEPLLNSNRVKEFYSFYKVI